MKGQEFHDTGALDPNDWYSDVLRDLCKAMRRDGLYTSAEALDDTVLVLQGELKSMRKEQICGRASSCAVQLRVVDD